MKSYDIAKDLIRIRKFFNLTQQDLADKLNVSRQSVIRWERGEFSPDDNLLEKIYSLPYGKHGERINLNIAKEMFYNEDKKDNTILFHGTTSTITSNPDNKHSVPPNDFGDGFYLGETLKQAATWVCDKNKASVYVYYLRNDTELKSVHFKVDRKWMYAILYFRGALKEFELPQEIKDIVNEVNECDYLTAPIADNQMYDVLSSFVRGEITDEACIHALSCTNLGYQYVLKSNKVFDYLEFIDRLYLCANEKQDYISTKTVESNNSQSKAELAKIEYRRKGKYFDELFKKS